MKFYKELFSKVAPIFKKIASGDLNAVKQYIENGGDIAILANLTGWIGDSFGTPNMLGVACLTGQIDIAKYLLNHIKPDSQWPSRYGMVSCIDIIFMPSGEEERAQLLKLFANELFKNSDPIFKQIAAGNLDAVKQTIEELNDVEEDKVNKIKDIKANLTGWIGDSFGTPNLLGIACLMGQVDIAKYLLDHIDPRLNWSTDDNRLISCINLIAYAASHEKLTQMIELLSKDNRLDLSSQNNLLLRSAVKTGNLAAIHKLLEKTNVAQKCQSSESAEGTIFDILIKRKKLGVCINEEAIVTLCNILKDKGIDINYPEPIKEILKNRNDLATKLTMMFKNFVDKYGVGFQPIIPQIIENSGYLVSEDTNKVVEAIRKPRIKSDK